MGISDHIKSINWSLSIASPDVALFRKMLIYKSKLRFFGLRAPNQKPL
jgi:hypothetical protein